MYLRRKCKVRLIGKSSTSIIQSIKKQEIQELTHKKFVFHIFIFLFFKTTKSYSAVASGGREKISISLSTCLILEFLVINVMFIKHPQGRVEEMWYRILFTTFCHSIQKWSSINPIIVKMWKKWSTSQYNGKSSYICTNIYFDSI